MKKLILLLALLIFSLTLLGCTENNSFEKTSTETNMTNGIKVTTEYYKSEDCPFVLTIAEFNSNENAIVSLDQTKTYLSNTYGSYEKTNISGYNLLEEPIINYNTDFNTKKYIWINNTDIISITQVNWIPAGNNSEFTQTNCNIEKSNKLLNEFTNNILKKYPYTSS